MEQDDYLAGRLMSDYMRSGWLRQLPRNAFTIFEAVLWLHVQEQPGELAEQPIGGRCGMRLAEIGGLHTSVWEQEESELAADSEADDEDRAALAQSKERLALAATALDMAVTTNAELTELMRVVGIFDRVEDEGVVYWRVHSPLPLPDERLPLAPDERAREDRLRWEDIHYENAQRLIGIFFHGELDVVTDSLEGFGVRLDLPSESVREAVLVLLDEGDFQASVDVERVVPDEQFELRVDWDKFAQGRIVLETGDQDE